MYASNGAGSTHETKPASATAAREAGGARTGALAFDLVASLLFASPALSCCLLRSLQASAFLFLTFTKPVGRGGSTIEPGATQQSRREWAEEEDPLSTVLFAEAVLFCPSPASG